MFLFSITSFTTKTGPECIPIRKRNASVGIFAQEEVETECKSPCPSSAEMCIEMTK